jgi:hypothetical protein
MSVPTFIQAVGHTQSGTATPSVSFVSNVTAGDAIICYAGSYITGTTCSAVNDSLFNSYTQIASGSGTQANITYSIWAAFAVTGGACTVTPTFGGSGNTRCAIAEYSNVSSFDQTNNGHGLSGSGPTSISSGNVTTTTAAEMLVGIGFINDNGAVFTPGSGYSLDLNNIDNTLATLLFIEDQAVSSTGTYDADGSFTGAFDGWSLALVTLAGGGSPPPPTGGGTTIFMML